jgi:ferritin-like metal-binding protein YciE
MKTIHNTITIESKQSKNIQNTFKPQQSKYGELQTLFIDLLKDMYWVENAMLYSLDKMSKNITSQTLSAFVGKHKELTKNNIRNLSEVFALLNETLRVKKCITMDGLIQEANIFIAETNSGVCYDAGIIILYQKMQHYKIATYGTLVAMAKVLEVDKVAMLFLEILEKDKKTDAILTQIAKDLYNIIPEMMIAD